MIDRVDEWKELGDNEKVVIVMDGVCRDETVVRQLRKCGRSNLYHLLPSPTSHAWPVLLFIDY